MLPSGKYQPIDRLSAAETWIYLQRVVAEALENPAMSEECENLVGSLGPQYEDDETAVLDLLQKINPQMGLDALLRENPSLGLNDPPANIVASVVATLLSLRPAITTPPR